VNDLVLAVLSLIGLAGYAGLTLAVARGHYRRCPWANHWHETDKRGISLLVGVVWPVWVILVPFAVIGLGVQRLLQAAGNAVAMPSRTERHAAEERVPKL
jgi:hypothetical protein